MFALLRGSCSLKGSLHICVVCVLQAIAIQVCRHAVHERKGSGSPIYSISQRRAASTQTKNKGLQRKLQYLRWTSRGSEVSYFTIVDPLESWLRNTFCSNPAGISYFGTFLRYSTEIQRFRLWHSRTWPLPRSLSVITVSVVIDVKIRMYVHISPWIFPRGWQTDSDWRW